MRSASSSPRFATDVSSLGTSTSPNTNVAIKKTAIPPIERTARDTSTPPPFATPAITAITPTHTMSSQTDVPSAYLTKERPSQPISPMIFASRVVALSHIAAPRKSDGTVPHPRNRWPTV